MDVSKARIDLAEMKPNSNGQASKLEFLNSEGQSSTVFRIGEKWKIVLEFEISSDYIKNKTKIINPKTAEEVVASKLVVSFEHFPSNSNFAPM